MSDQAELRHFSGCLAAAQESLPFVFNLNYVQSDQRALHEVRNGFKDLVYASEISLDVYERFKRHSQEKLRQRLDEDLDELRGYDTQSQNREETAEREIHWIHRYVTSVRALFFFIRAFQDAGYRLILESTGQDVGDGSLISKCLNPKKRDNPVASLIRKKIPDYEAWFWDMRDKRNTIKLGTPTPGLFSYSNRHFSSRLIFILDSKKTDVTFQYLGDSLLMSLKLAKLATEKALEAEVIAERTRKSDAA